MGRTKQFDEEEVLVKAMDLFWQKGCHATSIDSLVKHLGVNRQSLYNTFEGGKEGLFRKAFEKYRTENTERVKLFFETQDSVKEGLTQFFENNIANIFSDSSSKGCFMVNATTELANSNTFVAEASYDNREAFEEIFIQFLQKGVDNGEISNEKDLKAIASMLFVLQNGMQVVAKSKPCEEQLTNMVKTALSVLD